MTPPRRILRFSLKALLVLILICAVLAGWWRDRRNLALKVQSLENSLSQSRVAFAGKVREASLLQAVLQGDTLLGIGGIPGPGAATRIDYGQCKSLREALTLLEAGLRNDGAEKYASLISEATIKDAISHAVEDYDSQLDTLEAKLPGRRAHWMAVLKPAFFEIADDGNWPPGASFNHGYGWQDAKGKHHTGMSLRLEIAGDGGFGFGLPIIDLKYGHFDW